MPQTLASHKEKKKQDKRKFIEVFALITLVRHSDIRYLLVFDGNLSAVLCRAYTSNRINTRALEIFLVVDNN